MKIYDGKIIVSDDNEDEERSYIIEHIKVEFEEDIPNVIGVVRCTGISIDSNAPSEINSKAETELYNQFADVEYNDADGDESYREEAKEDISEKTGVDITRIEIE